MQPLHEVKVEQGWPQKVLGGGTVGRMKQRQNEKLTTLFNVFKFRKQTKLEATGTVIYLFCKVVCSLCQKWLVHCSVEAHWKATKHLERV